MNLSSFDRVPSQANAASGQAARPTLYPAVWHPLLCVTAFSTLALLMDVALAKPVHAQPEKPQPDSAAAIVQTRNNAPTEFAQLAESADLEQLANAASGQATDPAETSLDYPVNSAADDQQNLQTENLNQKENPAENTAIHPQGSQREAIEEAAFTANGLNLDTFNSELQLDYGEPEPIAIQIEDDSACESCAEAASQSLADAAAIESHHAAVPVPSQAPAETQIAQGGSALLGAPFIQLQGAVVLQGDEFSARARTTASYAITPNLLVGGTLDLVTGDAFTDSPEAGLNLNELYVAVSPSEIPTLRFAAGLLDYTSYFDRNSFAKDGVTQFFNPVFQTNPALAAAGLSSRPGLLVNWSVTDNLELRAAGFSSRRDLGDFALDGFAAEAAVRVQNLILRGTYLTAVDAGDDSGFREIFQFDRGNGDFGLRSGDREQAFGINAEYFVPALRLGLFARYGWYDNLTLGRGGETYSFGFNLLDLLLANDRLGLAYGRDLSNEALRRGDLPDVLELFYDAQLLPNLRTGFTAQSRNSFSETILGFRLRADFSLSDLGRIF